MYYELISFQWNADVLIFSVVDVHFNAGIKLAASTCLETNQLGQLSLASLRGRLIEYQLRLG